MLADEGSGFDPEWNRVVILRPHSHSGLLEILFSTAPPIGHGTTIQILTVVRVYRNV